MGTQNHPRPHLIITIIIIMTTTTPTPPPDRSRHRCDDDDDIDRILLEACPTLFEVDDDDDAVEDALGTIGIPHHPPADRNRQRADGKDGRRTTAARRRRRTSSKPRREERHQLYRPGGRTDRRAMRSRAAKAMKRREIILIRKVPRQRRR